MHRLTHTVGAIALGAVFLATTSLAQTPPPVAMNTMPATIGGMTDARIVEELRAEGRVAMSGTFFDTDSVELFGADETLFKLANAMQLLPEMRLAIVGHTDSVGDFGYNVGLSQRRADVIRNTLLGEPYNVPSERLVAMGAGSISPIASNLSEEGRALNRRVEFVLLDEALIGTGEPEPAPAIVPPTMAMTTQIPDGITTPDTVETQLGDLTFFDGVPDADAADRVYNLLDFTHAYQGYMDGVKIASMDAMRRGLLEYGPANTTVLQFADLMDSKTLFLTPNTTSVYQTAWLQLGDEPMVIETPPNVLGFLNDAWFRYVMDFGNLGPDEGQGGKFLILPPGYEGEVDRDGYTAVVPVNTFGHWVIWRGFTVDGSTEQAVTETQDLFRIYPLSQADAPPEMTFVNVSGEELNTIHVMDARMFDEINTVVQAEPLMGENPELLGHLAAIGIVKGQDFAPDARMQKILERAAAAGSVTVKTLISKPRDDRAYWYPGESYWQNAFPGGAYTWELDGVTLQDFRTAFHFYATGITPAMAVKAVGKGSQYALTYRDSDGNALDGSKTYKMNVPADPPAEDFWSFTLYDNQTRSMLQTDKQFPALGSNDTGVVQNADGSTDIYFGPEAPAGQENNWLQTVPGKGWNTILRLYGPLEPWFDQTWRPGEIELID